MSKTEIGKMENDRTVRMLSHDELDAVSGGLLNNTMVSGFAALEKAKAEAQAFGDIADNVQVKMQ